MYATCSICEDIFTGTHPEVIHSTPCGHLFHYICLVKWLQRSKTCPQCRSAVSEDKTIKLYFHIQDASSLENELGNLKFKLTKQNLDIKRLTDENEKTKSQAHGLKKKVKQQEEQIRNRDSVVTLLQNEVKVMKSQQKSLTDIELEAAELRTKLETFQSVEKILKGTAQQAAEQLDLMNDKDTSTLCTCISILKKEIDQYKEKNNYMQNQLAKTETGLSSFFVEIDKLRAMKSELSGAIEQYKSPSNDEINSPVITKKVMTSSDLPKDPNLFDDLENAECSKNLLIKCEAPSNEKSSFFRSVGDVLFRLGNSRKSSLLDSSERNQNGTGVYSVVLVGGIAPGKTSLIDRFVTGQFHETNMATIGVDLYKQSVNLDDTTVKFNVWDTEGYERFYNVIVNYCKRAAAAIVVYDTTDQSCFETAKSWVDRLPQLTPPNIVIALVGNKSDRARDRIVKYEEASQYAEEKELLFVETSAKTGKNVNDIFFAIYSILTTGSVHTTLDSRSVIPSRFRSNWNLSCNNSEKLLEERKKVESLKTQLLAQQKTKK